MRTHFQTKHIKEHSQYQYGGGNVSGEKTSAGVTFSVDKCEQSYNIGNDAMVVEYMPVVNQIVNGIIGFYYVRLHYFLQTLVNNRLF